MSVNDGLPEIEITESEVVEGEIVPGEIEVVDDAVTADSLGIDLPDDPDEAVGVLLREVAQARAEADRYVDDLRRVAADFDNYRKRTHREQAGLIDRASERTVNALLPVLDSLDAAAAIEARTPTEEKLLAGVRGTLNQLLDVLGKEGLQIIPTWDEEFDPQVHEAVTRSGEGDGPLVVTKELRRGYRSGGKTLRAALVEVAPRSESVRDNSEETPDR
ncbi:MAG TPA: nucleotide exchange factor GrpE [Acidimicrobiia bacterium]|nr:nucleotide exchange factor GrpE [Acidimicrobiia bacterium]